ncbi:MAG: hypothetical protein QNJ57_02575 [Flavobacteriaceae bacterium]|nr:hypothetical protein [Flavobacteriaceae bacterium]
MKRVIVDYKKLTQNILDLLVDNYPDGYNDTDIIQFKNAAGEWVGAVEVRTDDTIYLVKVGVKLEQKMENAIGGEDENTEEEHIEVGEEKQEFDEDMDD